MAVVVKKPAIALCNAQCAITSSQTRVRHNSPHSLTHLNGQDEQGFYPPESRGDSWSGCESSPVKAPSGLRIPSLLLHLGKYGGYILMQADSGAWEISHQNDRSPTSTVFYPCLEKTLCICDIVFKLAEPVDASTGTPPSIHHLDQPALTLPLYYLPTPPPPHLETRNKTQVLTT